jgi:hypothetical protein
MMTPLLKAQPQNAKGDAFGSFPLSFHLSALSFLLPLALLFLYASLRILHSA